MWRVLYFSLIFLIPHLTFAAVRISEVAWMGDATSATYEWIELHNTGSDTVDVTGWSMTGATSLAVSLAGTITADAYVVLERHRNSEEYVFHPPWLVYTGALVNTGTNLTLTLTREDGTVEDTVLGGDDWTLIGGDNLTKNTAQLSDSGWITAVPTPGYRNAQVSAPVDIIATSTKTAPLVTTASQVPTNHLVATKTPTAPPSLQLTITMPSLGYVNQALSFDVIPTGLDKIFLNSLVYTWNFGDTNSGTTKQSSHTYTYPGTYVVTVYANYAKRSQTTRHEITILPVIISLTSNSSGDVQVNNDSPYEIDLSGYRLAGGSAVYFPARTILLSRSTITIPASRLHLRWGQPVVLYDALQTPVATLGEDSPLITSRSYTEPDAAVAVLAFKTDNPAEPITDETNVMPVASASAAFEFTNEVLPLKPTVGTNTTPTTTLASLDEEVGGPVDEPSKQMQQPSPTYVWSYIGLAIILLVAIGALFLTKKNDSLQN